ncbi:GDYXXLXY domain-containing protein [Paraherbaspirillum soli]|uniref:GDYXXLXY domain-containing protein n=1 Tax=Paraherbaspirillum soli TaxID=631222 RepID=A0ABW0MA74_9BURK
MIKNVREMTSGSLIVIGLLLILATVNQAIWIKEQLLAHGTPVSLALAPVDPRSLMQGDYMALDWQLARDIRAVGPALPESGKAVLSLWNKTQGATFVRLDDGKPLAADEIRIDYRLRAGRVRLVTDAYFFQEGRSAAFAKARYGEFRVAPNGQALLVGLQDEHFVRINGEPKR